MQYLAGNTVDQQQLQLLHQIRQHLLSHNQVFLLYIAMALLLPVAWRLNFYHWLTTLPIPPMSPTTITVLTIIGPFLFVATVFLIILKGKDVVKLVLPLFFVPLRKKPSPKELIQLTFPADTGKSAYATEQLYTLLHTLARQKDIWGRLSNAKNEYSLEIVSTKDQGIRYVLATDAKFADIIKRNLLSYLPGIQIKEATDYLSKDDGQSEEDTFVGIEEFKLSSHFALPLETQKVLKEHDPISYLTGNMTRLASGELISFQVVISPILSGSHDRQLNEMRLLKQKMYKGEPLTPVLNKGIFQILESLPLVSIIWWVVKIAGSIVWLLFTMALEMIQETVHGSPTRPLIVSSTQVKTQQILNPYEQELSTVVKGKIDQQLFEVSIRLLVESKNKEDVHAKLNGLLASFGQLSSTYQSLTTKSGLFSPKLKEQLNWFRNRTLSRSNSFHSNPVLSASELSDLFHFPYTDTTKTEDMPKVHSPELPAPLTVKNTNFDVVFGRNTYGNSDTDIGVTSKDRSKHMYLIGRTGSGKSTIMYHMASQDIAKGRGTAVVDPHGDLAEWLKASVPLERANDFIYFDPIDMAHPIGINLLEIPEGLSGDELELEKELVAEGVISVFRRIFSKEENVNAHRIEYILRNTIYTAFSVPNCTLFTIYDLLNDPDFQKKVTKDLPDENLKKFWKNEFGRAGNYQIVKMVGGVTAKVGRFMFSPIAKRILEQPKSTINFDEVLDKGKILICNLSEGNLGEDTSQILGLTIIAKIHQAALRRARKSAAERTPFYLFVDEFQNFATTSFTRILSGGRKFGLYLTLAEQSTAQQTDRNIVNVILANTGTIVCFGTASPLDEQMLEPQFAPYITRQDIANLPDHHFYIKLTATKPEEPFSGETLPIELKSDPAKIEKLIAASRKNYTITYEQPKPKPAKKPAKVRAKVEGNHIANGLFPEKGQFV